MRTPARVPGFIACLLGALLLAGACRGGGEGAPAAPPANGDLERTFRAQYADRASARYQEAVTRARALAAAIDRLVAAPNQAALAAARQAWLEARPAYLETEVLRFADGPIDRREGEVNAWPIDESYIDAVTGAPQAGIVAAVAAHPQITAELLRSLNQREGEKNVSAGYHAIEFLLWGEDRDPQGPGQRSAADFAAPAPGAARRGQYLRVATALLVADLEEVAAAWAPGAAANYRAAFLALAPAEALRRVLKGLGTLAGPELGGERLTVAYETKDQENEHSCFSDSTHTDVIHDAIGIHEVVTGRWRGGPAGEQAVGLARVVAGLDPELGATLVRQADEALAAARAIPPPFDRAVQGADTTPGRRAIKRTIDALEALTASLARAAGALDVRLSFQL